MVISSNSGRERIEFETNEPQEAGLPVRGHARDQARTDRASGTGTDQGQFLNDQDAADFLSDAAEVLSEPTTIDLPDGLGQVIRPDGTVAPANKVTIVPKPNGGIRTAYPVAN